MTTTQNQPVTQRDFERLSGELGEMKTLMRQMADAVMRIAVIDERLTVTQKESDRTDRRLDSMEEQQRQLSMNYERDRARVHTTLWLIGAVWTAVGATGLAWIVPLLQEAAR